MIPPTVLLATFIALIGWPSIKLIATLIARPRWKEQRRLKTELLAEASTPAERALIEAEYNEGRGSPIQLILPPVALFGGIGAAFAHEILNDRVNTAEMQNQMYLARTGEAPSERAGYLMKDPRFRRLENSAFELSMLRYPVCTIATAFALIPAIVLLLVLTGFKASWRTFATAAGASSRQALRAFEHSFEGLYRGANL